MLPVFSQGREHPEEHLQETKETISPRNMYSLQEVLPPKNNSTSALLTSYSPL